MIRTFLLSTSMVIGLAISSHGEVVSFTDLASFNTATSGFAQTLINFDTLALNTPFQRGVAFAPSANPAATLAFTYSNAISRTLVATNGIIGSGVTPLATTSGSQFLGFSDFGQLSPDPTNIGIQLRGFGAIGMTLIFDTAPLPGDIRLTSTSGSGVASLGPSSGSVGTATTYFLGLRNDTGEIYEVSIATPNSIGDLRYRIDNIIVAVPEPSSVLLLVMVAAIGIAFRRVRRIRFQSAP